jgi:hypothetical protein
MQIQSVEHFMKPILQSLLSTMTMFGTRHSIQPYLNGQLNTNRDDELQSDDGKL